MEYGVSFEEICYAAQYIRLKTAHKPKIGIISGCGLGSIAESLTERTSILYSEIPDFSSTKISNFNTRFIFGRLNEIEVVLMQGHPHFYDGFSMMQCVIPVRILKILGVTRLIIVNHVGSINTNYSVGDIMIIKDHVNFPGFGGNNPLRGQNDKRWGTRFPSVADVYDPKLIDKSKDVFHALEIGGKIFAGVYGCVTGPNFETIAELNMLKICGVDVVGMSVVPEVLAAAHCGISVLGISVVTHKCIMDYTSKETITHDEILKAAENKSQDLLKFIGKVADVISNTPAQGDDSLINDTNDKTEISCEEIPNFPVSEIRKDSKLVFGNLNDTPVVILLGRSHFYEGFNLSKCIMPVRLMKYLGATHLITVSHAGAIREDFKVGDIMLVRDHLNFMGIEGNSPLRGSNDERWGIRFPAMNKAYDRKLIEKAKTIFRDNNIEGTLVDGVYACVGGPNFETIAEVKVLKTLGADAVGTSLAHEVIAARHCGMSVVALSVITSKHNMDYTSDDAEFSYENIIKVANEKEAILRKFISLLVKLIGTMKLRRVCKCCRERSDN